MIDRYDVIVIGGGHNGLVCASMLAAKNKSVLLLEANDTTGGAGITREFADGFSVSAGAHLLYQLQPSVRKALRLDPPLAAENIATIGLNEAGDHLRVREGSLEGATSADASSYRQFYQQTQRFARVLNRQLNAIPPRIGNSQYRDTLKLLGLGLDVRRLGRSGMREFLRMIGMNIYDELTERFDHPLLRGIISADATLGTHLGPRSPTTVLTYLYRMSCGGRLSIPLGGMGAVSEAMTETAEAAGVEIRTGARVESVVIENGRVAGVAIEGGERFESLTVVSGADPKKTVLELVGARHFEARFANRVAHIRASGNAAKLHLALDGLPQVPGLDADELGHRLLIAPDADYVERAFNPAKYGEFSEHPVIEITLPSVHDPDLARDGRQVLSAVVQYAPHQLKTGWTDEARQAFLECTLATMERYLPGLRKQIVASELLLPADIEREFGMTGGHWHHAELSFDQFMFVRPVAGAAQYALPLEGLFLCGAGAHPGGGISGAAGRNAALAILAKEKLRWL